MMFDKIQLQAKADKKRAVYLEHKKIVGDGPMPVDGFIPMHLNWKPKATEIEFAPPTMHKRMSKQMVPLVPFK